MQTFDMELRGKKITVTVDENPVFKPVQPTPGEWYLKDGVMTLG